MLKIMILSYLAFGLLFGLAFIAMGYKKIDPVASSAGLFVRLMWMPAAIALWPIVLMRWMKAS